MASAADEPRQFRLDVPQPALPRPRRVRAGRLPDPIGPPYSGQLELRMVPHAPPAPSRPPRPNMEAPVVVPAGPCFVAWLLAQGKRPGTLGELARAVRLDRSFPKRGSADDVRACFNRAGADGDAHEALDDAERDYERSRAA